MPEDLGLSAGLDQAQLSQVFGNPRAIQAFENLQRVALSITPAAVVVAQGTADDAVTAAATAQFTADTIAAAAFVTLAASGALDNERVLTATPGVTFDVATAGLLKLVVDALLILNLHPVVLTQPLTTTALECTSLKVDATAFASVTASDHSIPINCNGTIFYMRLSATP